MALKSYYNTGTASVDNGSAAVTGQGTAWSTVGIKAGDFFVGDDGRLVPIASVDSETSLTLIKNWPGTTQAGAAYQIVEASAGARIIATTQALLEKLSGGNVTAFSGLVGAADKVPYFTGAGAMAVADFTSFGRTLTALEDAAAGRSALELGDAAQQVYEVGVWTPRYEGATTAGTYTYTTQEGFYIRIGRLIWLEFFCAVDAVSAAGSGTLIIKGLPYNSDTGNLKGAGSISTVVNAINPSNFNGWSLRGHTSDSLGITYFNGATGNTSSPTIDEVIQAGTQFRGTCVRRVAAA